MRPAQMRPNWRYKIRHRIQDLQRYDRESILVFIGIDPTALEYGGQRKYVFSGRDFKRDTRVCGTTELSEASIISVEEVPDEAALYANRRAPTQERIRKK